MYFSKKLNLDYLFERAIRLIFRSSPLQCLTTKRYKCKCKCRTNTPHPPKDPPENYRPGPLAHYAFEAPENVHSLVFRPLTENEIIGPKAAKNHAYKNPEYYSYHRYSHVDLFMNAMRIRLEKRIEAICSRGKTEDKIAAKSEPKAKDDKAKPKENPKEKPKEKPTGNQKPDKKKC